MNEQTTIPSHEIDDGQAEALDNIMPKLEQLEQELHSENPEIDQYLLLINQDLRQYPGLEHLLTDEQIKPIYLAMRQKTDVKISVKASRAKGKGAKGKLDDGRNVADLL